MAHVDFAPEHAFRHKMGPDGRESLAHTMVLPEHGIAGFVYPTVRTGGLARGRASLFGPGLAEPIHEEVELLVPDTMDFDDWHTGPLTMRVIEPHQTVEIGWAGEQLDFNLRYEAMHPAFAFSSHPLGNPGYYGDDRTEQHGRITGRLAAPGVDVDINAFMVRDHSWGPRIWGVNQHHKWFHAVTESCSVHFFEMNSFGRRQVRGYLYRDGLMHHVTAADYEIEYDDKMMHTRMTVTVTDADGRKVHVDARTIGATTLEFDPMVYLNEAGLVLEIDGEPGTGWCEFCWNRNYFDFAREYVSIYG